MERQHDDGGEQVFLLHPRRRSSFVRRLRPQLLLDTARRIKADSGWFAMVAHANRPELWAGKLNAGEACLAVVDPAERAVVWFAVDLDDPDDAEVAEACLPGAGVLWSVDSGDEVPSTWARLRHQQALVVLADAADADLDMLRHLAEIRPSEVEQALDIWLEGSEGGAAGMIKALMLREVMDSEQPPPTS